MAKTPVNDLVVNTGAISKMFNVTERRVRQLVEEGVISRVGHGRFDLVDTVSKYVTFLKLASEGLDENDISESLEFEKWLHEKAKREKAEIELAHIKNEVHRSEEVEKVMNHMIMAFRSKMLSLPTKVALMLVNKDDPKYIESILERNVHEALIELANYDPSLFIELVEDERDLVEVDAGDAKANIKAVPKGS